VRDSHGEHLTKRFIRAREKLLPFLQHSRIKLADNPNNVSLITNESLNEDEVYWPLPCGLFVNMWVVGATQQVATSFNEIITGQCLFGSNMLYGMASGIGYDLCVPNLVVDKDALIDEIFMRDSLHPYELLARATFDNLGPLIKSLLTNDKCMLSIHLPVEEYLLNFLDLLLNHQITEKAFFDLRKIILARAQMHRQYWEQYSQTHQIVVNHDSPLVALNLTSFTSLQALLGQELVERYQNDKSVSKESYQILIAALLNKMIYASGKKTFNEAWTFVESQHRVLTLKELSKESYTVKIAATASMHNDCEVLLLHPIQEKPMALSYKKNYTSRFRPIVSLNWVQPLQISNFSKSLIYYLVYQHEYFNYLIKYHIQNRFKQTQLVAAGKKEEASHLQDSIIQDFADFCLKQEILNNLRRSNATRLPFISKAPSPKITESNTYRFFKTCYSVARSYWPVEEEKQSSSTSRTFSNSR
jgi:hypothetical protein